MLAIREIEGTSQVCKDELAGSCGVGKWKVVPVAAGRCGVAGKWKVVPVAGFVPVDSGTETIKGLEYSRNLFRRRDLGVESAKILYFVTGPALTDCNKGVNPRCAVFCDPILEQLIAEVY